MTPEQVEMLMDFGKATFTAVTTGVFGLLIIAYYLYKIADTLEKWERRKGR